MVVSGSQYTKDLRRIHGEESLGRSPVIGRNRVSRR
jgi:hypothetical protein